LHEAPIHRSTLDSVPLLLAARQADVDWVSDFTGRFIEANFGMSALKGRHISNKAAAMGA
jgi:hypothetical protein